MVRPQHLVLLGQTAPYRHVQNPAVRRCACRKGVQRRIGRGHHLRSRSDATRSPETIQAEDSERDAA